MLITKVIDAKNQILREQISPNIIFNRFDIKYGDDYELWKINSDGADYYIATHLDNGVIDVSLCMVEGIPDAVVMAFFKFLFDNSAARYIAVNSAQTKIPGVRVNTYRHIDLSKHKDVADFDKSLSQRVRYNTKWYPKKNP